MDPDEARALGELIESLHRDLEATKRSEDLATENLGQERTLHETSRTLARLMLAWGDSVPRIADAIFELTDADARALAAAELYFDARVQGREAREKLIGELVRIAGE